MRALKFSLFLAIFSFIALTSFAAEKVDTFSITTYYPVPYVSYKEVETNTISSQETEVQEELIKEVPGVPGPTTVLKAKSTSFPGTSGDDVYFDSLGTLDTIVLEAFDSELLAEKIEGLLELHQGEDDNIRVFKVWPGLGECWLINGIYWLGFYDANCGPNAAIAYIRENPFGVYIGAGAGVGGFDFLSGMGIGTGMGVKVFGSGQLICCALNEDIEPVPGGGGPPCDNFETLRNNVDASSEALAEVYAGYTAVFDSMMDNSCCNLSAQDQGGSGSACSGNNPCYPGSTLTAYIHKTQDDAGGTVTRTCNWKGCSFDYTHYYTEWDACGCSHSVTSCASCGETCDRADPPNCSCNTCSVCAGCNVCRSSTKSCNLCGSNSCNAWAEELDELLIEIEDKEVAHENAKQEMCNCICGGDVICRESCMTGDDGV